MSWCLNHQVESRLPWSVHTHRPSHSRELNVSQSKERDFISLSLGSMLWCRNDYVTHQLAGPKHTNSTRVISVALLTASMNGLIAWVQIDPMLTLIRSHGMLFAHSYLRVFSVAKLTMNLITGFCCLLSINSSDQRVTMKDLNFTSRA